MRVNRKPLRYFDSCSFESNGKWYEFTVGEFMPYGKYQTRKKRVTAIYVKINRVVICCELITSNKIFGTLEHSFWKVSGLQTESPMVKWEGKEAADEAN